MYNPNNTEHKATTSPANDIGMWLPAPFLTCDPWISDGEVPAKSWKLRKYVCVRFGGAHDESSPAKRKGWAISPKRTDYADIPPKKVLKRMHKGQYSALHSHKPKDSREIHASRRNHIATAEVEIVVFKSLYVIETTARISKCQEGDESS